MGLIRCTALFRLAGFLLAIFAVSMSSAQSYSGSVEGVITDQQGGRISQAQMTVRSLSTGEERTARTSGAGAFRLDGLQPGEYEIIVMSSKFIAGKAQLTVRLGEVSSLEISLKVSGPTEELHISGNLPDRDSSTIGNPVTGLEILNSPLANRSFANIAYIAPMTAPVEPSDPTKARITAVSFAGSSGLNIDLSVDGADNNDDYIGGFLQSLSPELIQEFNVRTAQFDADTSRTNGGSIVISTRSGSNHWHGSVAGFFRADALNARNDLDNPEPNPKQPYSKQDYTATLGGPVIPGRLWLFTSYEYNHENASVAYSALNLSEFQALAQAASAGQIPGVPSLSVPSSVLVPFRDHLFSSRLDWKQSELSHWFLRTSTDRYDTANDMVAQGGLPATGFTTRSHYYDTVISNQFAFSPQWLGSFLFSASLFDHNKIRNSNLGFALAFPFSSTTLTTSGFETFGDNQFVTPITAFPIERDQQKYQLRYDLSRGGSAHNWKFGTNFIHEPVLRGSFADSAERLILFSANPSAYASGGVSLAPWFSCDPEAAAGPTACPDGAAVVDVPAGDGNFAQSVRRLGFYGQDDWHATPHLTVNYGLRYDTTFGLFVASGKDQNRNEALLNLRQAGVSFADGIPHDYRGAVAPRLGIAYAPGQGSTVLRSGFGLYYNDLAQNGWAQAFQAVNSGLNPPAAMIDPNYKTPYALQASAAVEHQFDNQWRVAAQFEHQQGVHQYRRYEYVQGISLPDTAFSTSVFRSDNRSSYNGASLIVQHRGGRYDVTAHYTLARATTWGATVGELFDYVNGVSDPLNPFGPGDHGPSGEDIRHRLVVNGVFELPGRFQISALAQFESARPYTMSTPFDINGDGNVNDRAVVNGIPTSLDQFRGTPFSQIDLRVSRDFHFGERISVRPLVEMFNVLNRSNPGNNFVGDIGALPTPVNDPTNATAFCLNADCTATTPIRSFKDLRAPAGALGDFFGPGTTVGIPFAAQFGVRVTF